MDAEPGGLEGGQEDVASLAIVGEEPAIVAVGHQETRHGGLLEGSGCSDGQEVVDAAHPDRELG